MAPSAKKEVDAQWSWRLVRNLEENKKNVLEGYVASGNGRKSKRSHVVCTNGRTLKEKNEVYMSFKKSESSNIVSDEMWAVITARLCRDI